MPDTASPIEVFWLVRCIVGGLGVAILVYLAIRDNVRLHESGENGAMEIQAHGNIVVLVLLSLTQFIGASLAIPALFLPTTDYVPDPSAWATFSTFYSPIAVVVAFFMLDGVAIWKYVIRLRVDAHHGRDFALRLQQHQADLAATAASVAHTDEMTAATLVHAEERAVDAAAHAGDRAEGIKIGREEEATAATATADAVASALVVAGKEAAARAAGVAEGNAALLAAQPGVGPPAVQPASPAQPGAAAIQAALGSPEGLSQSAKESVADIVTRGIDDVTAAIKADTGETRAKVAEIKAGVDEIKDAVVEPKPPAEPEPPSAGDAP